MADETETLESKINRNVEALRQTFEPLAATLTPDVEPAVIYRPSQPVNDHS